MKKRGLFSIIFDYAGPKKKYYIFSIITSLISVVAGIIPFYFIASIINKLIEGNKDFSAYTLDIILPLIPNLFSIDSSKRLYMKFTIATFLSTLVSDVRTYNTDFNNGWYPLA